MSANAVALKKQEEQTQTTTPEQKAQPVPISRETKQEERQQKEREKSIARGEIFSPEQRLEALKKLSPKAPDGKDAMPGSATNQFYHLGKDIIMVGTLTDDQTAAYNVVFVRPDTKLTDTHHSIRYKADGTFDKMDRDVWTLLRGNFQAGVSRMTQKETVNSLSAEKFGDKLIKEALELSSKGKSHFSL